jgi:glycosyltransferase involved in cell wall biosynthesis
LRVGLVSPVLSPYVPAGGINKYVQLLAEQLAVRGHQITVIGREIHGHPVPAETAYTEPWGRSVAVMPFGIGAAPRRGFLNLRAALGVADFLRRNAAQFDIVETTNWLGHGAFCSLGGIPYVARVSTPSISYLESTAGVRHLTWLEGRSCRRAAKIVGHSRSIVETIAPLYRTGKVPAEVIPLGIDATPLPQVTRSTQYFDVAYVGRAEHRKGTDVMIRALLAVADSAPRLRMTLIGADIESYLRERADLVPLWSALRRRYGNRLRSLGVISEQEKLEELARAHAVVIPSRYESFGLVAVEAMRAGTPVIAAAGGALADVCANGPGNFVYDDPESSVQLAAALLDSYRRGALWAEARRQPLRAAFERVFTVDRFVDSTIDCYHRTLATFWRGSMPPERKR